MNMITVSPTEVRDKYLIRDGKGPCMIHLNSGHVCMSLPHMEIHPEESSEELKLFMHAVSQAAYVGYVSVKLEEDQEANTDIAPRFICSYPEIDQESLRLLHDSIDDPTADVTGSMIATEEEPIIVQFRSITFKESEECVFANVDCVMIRLSTYGPGLD